MKRITEDEILQLIGRVTVFYATLDLFIAMLCHTLISDNSLRRKILNAKTLGQRAVLLSKLEASGVVNSLALSELQIALPEVNKLSEIRNRFIHDQWLFNKQNLERGEIDSIRIEINKDGKLIPETTRYTRSSIMSLIERFGEAQKIVANVMAMVDAGSGKDTKKDLTIQLIAKNPR